MKLFKRQDKEEKDVSYLNQVSRYGLTEPNYKQDLSKTRIIEFAYIPDEEKVFCLAARAVIICIGSQKQISVALKQILPS